MGAMVDVNHAKKVEGFLNVGKVEAKLIIGGDRFSINDSDAFIQPTIFSDVPEDAVIARDEIFGPVLAIQTFDTEIEALDTSIELAQAAALELTLADTPTLRDFVQGESVSQMVYPGIVLSGIV